MSPLAWRKAITVGNAFNPNPLLDMALGAIGQGLTDSVNPNLSGEQKLWRVVVAGGESALTGFTSDVVGAGVALGGGGPGGYAGAQVATSLVIDFGVWPKFNRDNKYLGGLGY
jgi:hypothetical protein